MSNYLDNKSNELDVTHEFSGKYHFFNVKNGKKSYGVKLHLSCECEYSQWQGYKYGKLCSHILAVMKHIVNKKGDFIDTSKNK